MTLNQDRLEALENSLTNPLSPEQKAILMLWFASDSVFGWTKQDIILGLERVRHFYPDHRMHLYRCCDSCFPDEGSDLMVAFAPVCESDEWPPSDSDYVPADDFDDYDAADAFDDTDEPF